MWVNAATNERQKLDHPEAILYKAKATLDENSPQSFWVWPGLELIGCGGRAKKGLFYVVQSCTPARLVATGNGETISLTPEQVMSCLRLSHALTYAACQGLSLPGVRLLQTDSPHFGWKHLYVGSSRCTSSRLLEVA